MKDAVEVQNPVDELKAHLRRIGEYHLHFDGAAWRLIRSADNWKCRQDPQCCARLPYVEEAK